MALWWNKTNQVFSTAEEKAAAIKAAGEAQLIEAKAMAAHFHVDLMHIMTIAQAYRSKYNAGLYTGDFDDFCLEFFHVYDRGWPRIG